MRSRRLAALLLGAAGAWCLAASPAVAATFTVTNANDDGPGSLRAALAQANLDQAPDSIAFDPGVSGTIALTSGVLGILSPVTIEGPGAEVLAVSGGDAMPVFDVFEVVEGGPEVEISGLAVRDGLRALPSPSLSRGGAIFNSADLTLTDVVVSDSAVVGWDGPATPSSNFGGGAVGGGIASTGELTLIRTTVTGNAALGGDGGGDGGAVAGSPGSGQGGGVYSEFGAILTVTDSVIAGNTATGGDAGNGTLTIGGNGIGGGVRASGDVTIVRSTIAGNSAVATGGGVLGAAIGGGIDSSSGTVSIRASTLSDNQAVPAPGGNASGGAIQATSNLTLANSTISGNAAAGANGRGGGVLHSSTGMTAALRGVTLAGNEAATGANLVENAAATVQNTIIAEPQGGGANCLVDIGGGLDSLGHNLEDAGSCGLDRPSDLTATDPALGPLADNGGPTRTRAPGPASPAIDAGSSAGLAVDQRGVTRPQDFFQVANAAGGFDIGAFEREIPVRRCRGRLATLVGTDAGETIRGTPRADVIFAGGGRDRVLAGAGNDLVCGGAGNDALIGGRGGDVLDGGRGHDRLLGGPGRDRLFGGPGRDLLRGGPGRDLLRGGPGRNRLHQ